MHIVERRLQRLYRRQRFVLGQALGIAFVGADAQADDEIRRGSGAYRRNHFAQKAQALFQLAVVAIGAAVDPWVDELRRQIAVAGDHFDAVDPGLVEASGSIGVALHDLVDHRLVEGPRHHPEAFIGYRRG
ncbi:hypothetical protein D3C77_245180 [compost metagenome]